MKAREFLYESVTSENREYFGIADENWLASVCDAWMDDESNSKARYERMTLLIEDDKLRKLRILDMASGCGSFVFYGLMNGYDVSGIEPEKWKHEFNLLKAEERGYPKSWVKRMQFGVGENLPFENETFDVISTYQTLEHVRSVEKCLGEFKRVLKRGGYLFINCPDYSSFYEAHYRIPMLPFMNKQLFKLYLKVLKKPSKGLEIINYTSQKNILKNLNRDYKIYDLNILETKAAIQKKIRLNSSLLARTYIAYQRLKNLFRAETTINLAAIKK